MKIHILSFFLIFMSLGLTHCGYLQKLNKAKRFTIERQWVRSTLLKENYQARLNHKMTPIVYGQLIVQGNSMDGVVAYDRVTGNEKWRISLDGGVEAGAVIKNGRLYFGSSDGFFYSVNANDGKIYWTFPINSEGLGAPVIQDGKVYFVSGNNIAYALNAETGRQLWIHNRRDPSNISVRGSAGPEISGDIIYFGFSDGAVVALNKNSGHVLWEKGLNQNKRFRDVDAKPIVDDDQLYISSYDEAVFCLNKKTGTELWKIDGGGASPVTVSKQNIYFATSQGEVVAADKKSGKVIWKIKTSSGMATQPVIYNHLLIFGESSGSFQVVNKEDGTAVGSFSTGRGILSTPQMDTQTGEAFFITVNADLYAVKLSWKSNVEVWPWQKNNH